MNREFLQLAHTYDSKKHCPIGYFVSEKLDGQRAFWDGGITTGMDCKMVPWANTAKNARLKVQPISTGLWSRYGHPIFAPDWWLEKLPDFPLDGELYIQRQSFQELASIIKRFDPSEEWKRVKYYVFDAPNYRAVFQDGRINNTNFKKEFSNLYNWLKDKKIKQIDYTVFESVYTFLKNADIENDVVRVHTQVKLPMNAQASFEKINQMLDDVTSLGGEGLMLRRPGSSWIPKRTNDLIKMKRFQDMEVVVVGYTSGRKTDKGSKLLGLMGALICEKDGKRFEISGFTDQERSFSSDAMEAYAATHPGEVLPDWFTHPLFPIKSIITIRYRELTDDGIPKEARYWRKS